MTCERLFICSCCRASEGPSDLLAVAAPLVTNSTPSINYEKLMEQLKEMNDKVVSVEPRAVADSRDILKCGTVPD